MSSVKKRAPEEHLCHVMALAEISASVWRVRLQPRVPSVASEFMAGQYLEILLPDGRSVPYSIASAPAQGSEIELHIQNQGADSLSSQVLKHLGSVRDLRIRMPQGKCFLDPADLLGIRQLVFIAAGTGFAQMKSMIEAAIDSGIDQELLLLWGAKDAAQFYDLELPQRWQREHSHFRFVPMVDGEGEEPPAGGMKGNLVEGLQALLPDASHSRFYACGSPGMVYAVEDQLLDKGLEEGELFSDVFAYAPRPAR